MQRISLLIATADRQRRDFLAAQLSADGHEIHVADSTEQTTDTLAEHAIDVLLLGDFDSPADAPALLRDLRTGQLHARVHRAQPVVTLGDAADLATVRAYEAGSDHHVRSDSAYLVVRAVITAVARRTLDEVTSRHLHIGALHIDTGGRTVQLAGRPVQLSRLEFELLCQLASDPTRVFSKDELLNALWGHKEAPRTRTLDSHAHRLRGKLAREGGHGFIANRWGHGYKLHATD